MKKAYTFILSLALGALVLAASQMPAWAQSHHDTPLLVVRFNQERVHYQQPLYNAIARAVDAKPGVAFNIVTLIPQTTNERQNQKSTVSAQQNTNAVVRDMVQMGVPQNRIRVSYQQSGGLEGPEVHIFVE